MKKIKRKNKSDRQLEKFLKFLIKLPHDQYLGVARILNVSFTEVMKVEQIKEEIQALQEELEKFKEEENNNVAPDGMENSENSSTIEENNETGAETQSSLKRIEAMEKRLEKLKEQQDLDPSEITIQHFRTGEAIMEDTIKKFQDLSNTKKKNLLAILKAGAY